MTEFTIFEVPVRQGVIGVSPIPGRSGSYEADLSAVLHWGAGLVLTMTTQAELDRMGASALGDDLRAVDVGWAHLPVQDFGAPDGQVRHLWDSIGPQAADLLEAGGKVLVHCFGGCGRSGMIALRLMVEAGEAPEAALARLRSARACAVEREAQFDWAAAGV